MTSVGADNERGKMRVRAQRSERHSYRVTGTVQDRALSVNAYLRLRSTDVLRTHLTP